MSDKQTPLSHRSSDVPRRVAVMAIKPLARWAIVPASLASSLPAIPFYRRSAAVQRAQEYVTERDLFADGILLVRLRFHRRMEVVECIPKQEGDDA